MLNEFKDFINRGNVVELAVGLVIGAAFGVVVKSFVDDLLMPIVGLMMGGINLVDSFIILGGDGDYASLAAAKEAGANALAYGNFISVIITFLFTAFAVFMVARTYNKMKARMEKEEAAAPAEPAREEVLLEEIRDLLKR